MKYFKYKNIKKVQKNADKEFLASLGKDQEKKAIKSRRLKKMLSFSGIALFFILFGAMIYLITLIPKPESTFLAIVYGIGCVFLGMIALVASGIVVVFSIGTFMEKVDYNLPRMRRNFMANACKSIREYYGLKDEYLITKCFDSSNSIFKNHDICIFRFDDEIRITTDIVNGFINGQCDLGCYAIKMDELKIYKDDFNKKRVTVLEFANEKFIIGIKAYSYILNLISLKTYNYFFKSLTLTNQSICLRKRKHVKLIQFKNIEKIEFAIPKYTSIPGSGYDYAYTFAIFEVNSKNYRFNIVLEKNEEKEIIDFLQDKKVNVVIKYYDNKNDD